jgi:hypothetical protein
MVRVHAAVWRLVALDTFHERSQPWSASIKVGYRWSGK